MKREDLEAREFGLIIASSNFQFYAAPEADAVMDAMEDRIKELERALIVLINRIDHAYGEDNSVHPYGDMRKGGLAYTVADQVIYVKKLFSDICVGGSHQETRIQKPESQFPKWISVKDRLPTSCTTQYLVYNETTKEYGESFFSLILECFQFKVTHWMPLPPPPTTEEK